MADDAPTAPVVSAPTPAPSSFDLTLDEWCARESMTERRVELLAAFHFDERTSGGPAKDSAENFASRYAAFAVRPV